MSYKRSENVISYYRDCYQHDSSDLNLWNLLKLKSQERLLLSDKDEIGSGFLPRLPIPTDFSMHMLQQVETYQREKILLYVSFILVGKLLLNGESRSIVAPLIYNEASIEEEHGDYYFSLDNDQHDINENLIQAFFPEGCEPPLPAPLNSEHADSHWVAYLKNSPLQIDTLSALKFPKMATSSELLTSAKNSSLSLLPVSMLVLVERAKSSRAVLHELNSIIETKTLSAPLNDLLGEEPAKSLTSPLSLKYDYLPGLLSNTQKKALKIAAQQPLGCVSGPPGTGKSYTIAAIAAEHVARSESVLIVANNDVALNVIANKLADNFGLGDISIRAGQKEFLKALKVYIADLLAGYHQAEQGITLNNSERELALLNTELQKLERQFIKFCRSAIVRGQRLHGFERRKSQYLTRVYLYFASGSMRKMAKQWDRLKDINNNQQLREKLAAQYLENLKSINLQYLIDTQRQSLQAFNKAIRSRTSKRQFELFDDIDYKTLLAAFPVWLVSLNSLFRVLPLQREMFDLVVIDESTQATISSAIPALYRAKRALIIGDTKQLRHYSFLAKNKEASFLAKYSLNNSSKGVVSYRDNSILDLALTALNSNQQLAFLDEHFRSNPELIHFSNRHFYADKLKIMQHRPCTSSGFLHLQRIDGSRDKSGFNKLEAQAVIAAITRQIDDDQKQGVVHSLGVISPFRHQAEYIAKLIEKSFDTSQIKSHQLRAGTAYGFQGEERDIMFISFALDDHSLRAAAYLNKADVFNVSITRARQKQWLFLSLDEKKLADNNLLRLYVEDLGQFAAQHQESTEMDDFQRDVSEALRHFDIDTWLNYQLVGTQVDVLCRHQDKYLALDLIGFPGPWADFFELNSYKVLQRAGIQVLPISYGLWQMDRNTCIEQITTQLGIKNKYA